MTPVGFGVGCRLVGGSCLPRRGMRTTASTTNPLHQLNPPLQQARIVALNAHYFLKTGGHIVVSIKASCIDSTAAPEAVFQKEVRFLRVFCASCMRARVHCVCGSLGSASWTHSHPLIPKSTQNPPQVKKLQEEKFKPLEQLTLEPYERDHAVVVATYRPIPKPKK